MQIFIAAIGRMKPSPEKQLLDKYIQQTPWQITLKEYEPKKGLSDAKRIEAEAAWLLDVSADCPLRIAMDERGKPLASEALAQKLGQWRDAGDTPVAFLIGGQDGLHQSVRDASRLTLSFGAATWPHMLARAMLTEQLYRAHTILTGHPYHRA